MTDLVQMGHTISVWFLPVVLAITLHEAAHAWMADKLGDDTARQLGRVSFNPIRHVDPVGTLILPGLLVLVSSPFLFGWAKPVPVAFHRLNNPKRDMIWVVLAGPGINIILALICALVMHAVGQLESNQFTLWLWHNLGNAVLVNVVLAVFNMLPLPPLDGGRVVVGLLPPPYDWKFARIERYGFLILLGLIFILPMILEMLGIAYNPLTHFLLAAIGLVHDLIMLLAGWG